MEESRSGGVLQRSDARPNPFNIYINDLKVNMGSWLVEFVDGIRIGRVVDGKDGQPYSMIWIIWYAEPIRTKCFFSTVKCKI